MRLHLSFLCGFLALDSDPYAYKTIILPNEPFLTPAPNSAFVSLNFFFLLVCTFPSVFFHCVWNCIWAQLPLTPRALLMVISPWV